MKKTSRAVFVSLLSAAGISFAQNTGEVRESTDPARAAEVERRAQEIMSGQPSTSGAGSGASTGATSGAGMQQGSGMHQRGQGMHQRGQEMHQRGQGMEQRGPGMRHQGSGMQQQGASSMGGMQGGVRESTDPAKVADVERRAQEIINNQQGRSGSMQGTSGGSGASMQGGASGASGGAGDMQSGVRESTDPAKVADVERRAQEIINNQQSGNTGSSGAMGTTRSTRGQTNR